MTDPRRRYDVVLRRQVRDSQLIEIPEAAPIPKSPGVRDRAKRLAFLFLLLMLAGAVLLATPLTTRSGQRTPILDAFFTSVSAASVAGLTTVDTQTHWNGLGQAVILVLMQVGGLGFMVSAGTLFQLSRGGHTTIRQSLFCMMGLRQSTCGRPRRWLNRSLCSRWPSREPVGWY